MTDHDQPAPEPTQSVQTTASAAVAPNTAPAINPPRWRGRKTAVAAALAIGLSSAGAVAAAATVEQGSAGGEGAGPGRGQGFPGGGGGPQQGRNQAPNQTQQGSGQQAPARVPQSDAGGAQTN